MKLEITLYSSLLNISNSDVWYTNDTINDVGEGHEHYFSLSIQASKAFAPSRLLHLFDRTQTEPTKLAPLTLTLTTKKTRQLLCSIVAHGLSKTHEPLQHTIGYGDNVIRIEDILAHSKSGGEYRQKIRMIDYPADYEENRWHMSSVPPNTTGPLHWNWEVRAEVELGFRVTEITEPERLELLQQHSKDFLPANEANYRELLSHHVNQCMRTHQSFSLASGVSPHIKDYYAPSYPSAVLGLEIPAALALTTPYDLPTSEELYQTRMKDILNRLALSSEAFISIVSAATNNLHILAEVQEHGGHVMQYQSRMVPIEDKSLSEIIFALVHGLLTSPMACMPYSEDISYVHNGSGKKVIVEQLEPKRTHKFDCEDGSAEIHRTFVEITRRATDFASPLLQAAGLLLRHYVCTISRFEVAPHRQDLDNELHLATVLIPRFVMRVWICRGFLERYPPETYNVASNPEMDQDQLQTIHNTFMALKAMLDPPDWWYQPKNREMLSQAVYQLLPRHHQLEISNAYTYCHQLCDASVNQGLIDFIRESNIAFPAVILCDSTTYAPTILLSSSERVEMEQQQQQRPLAEALEQSIAEHDCTNHIAVIEHPVVAPLFDEFYSRIISMVVGSPLVELVRSIPDSIAHTHPNLLHAITLDFALLDRGSLSTPTKPLCNIRNMLDSLKHFALYPLHHISAQTLDAAIAVVDSDEPIESFYQGIPEQALISSDQGLPTSDIPHLSFPYLHIRSMFYQKDEVDKILARTWQKLQLPPLQAVVRETSIGATSPHPITGYMTKQGFYTLAQYHQISVMHHIELLTALASREIERVVFQGIGQTNPRVAERFMAAVFTWVLSLPMTYVSIAFVSKP